MVVGSSHYYLPEVVTHVVMAHVAKFVMVVGGNR